MWWRQLQRRPGNDDDDKSSPRHSITIIDNDVIVTDRKRKSQPATSRSVTWGRDILLVNHCNPGPAPGVCVDDDDVRAPSSPHPCSTDDIIWHQPPRTAALWFVLRTDETEKKNEWSNDGRKDEMERTERRDGFHVQWEIEKVVWHEKCGMTILKITRQKLWRVKISRTLPHFFISTCYLPGAFSITQQYIWQLFSVHFRHFQLVTISPSSWPRTDQWPVTGRCFQQYYQVATRYDDHSSAHCMQYKQRFYISDISAPLYGMVNNFHV